MKTVTIADRAIGPGTVPFIVAEMSANHNGSLDRALAILDQAKLAGADAVKLQTYTPESMTWNSKEPSYVLSGGLWDGQTLFDLYRKAHTPRDWHPTLFDRARKLGLILFSTPFDEETVDYLERFSPPAYKIASMEMTDMPLIERVGRTGKPMILSTGNCSQQEIEAAITCAIQAGAVDIILLHCISAYPAPAQDSNLRIISRIAKSFGRPVGLSDHSEGTVVATTAVALGACLIEKHFTLDRHGGGPDDPFSIEPGDLRRLADDCRTAWIALGTDELRRAPSERAMRDLRRSLFVVTPMRLGDIFTRDTLKALRPAIGLPPAELPNILGKRASRDVAAGTPLAWNIISE